jgi:hypothetical protein
LWVGATTWTRWRRCPHLPSVLSLTIDSEGGAVVRVCGDEKDRNDHDQRGGSECTTAIGTKAARIGSSSRPRVAQRGGGSQCFRAWCFGKYRQGRRRDIAPAEEEGPRRVARRRQGEGVGRSGCGCSDRRYRRWGHARANYSSSHVRVDNDRRTKRGSLENLN